jgi:predicted adenine nucleotide alpha hydrolase (AANH) superfamily ATPase
MINTDVRKVLLHICCGICSFSSIERLKEEGFYVEGFFYNPNIAPYEEYLKRRDVTFSVGEITGVKIIEGAYDMEKWKEVSQKYEAEGEGGKRCQLCYELRLAKTLKVYNENNFDYFTTTLTISPHKPSPLILSIGERLGGDKFLQIDFKKREGFKNTIDLAKKYNLYRQNYCGCIASKKQIKGQGAKNTKKQNSVFCKITEIC